MSRKMLFNIGEEGKLVLNFINGKTVNLSSSSTFDVIEPRSGKILSKCQIASEPEVDSTVRSAYEAQLKWCKFSWTERGEVLRNAADLIKANHEELARWECIDNGKPLYEAKMDVLSCVDTFSFFAGIGLHLAGQHVPMNDGRYAFTVREPIGVVGCVGAWNYPIQTCTWKTAPALACGNSIVYKPSHFAPVSAVLLGQLLKEAGLPDGVFNVIQGDGSTGKFLVEHPLVKKVSFTGSIPTGKKIMQACAARKIKPVTLELGGKSALVVCSDADVDSAVHGALAANFYSQGQVCSNASKVLVHESILQGFTEKVVNITKAMKVGDPLKDGITVGAHITKEHRDKVKGYIDGAIAEGAKKLCGGEYVTVNGLPEGFYLSPCVLTNIDETMTIYKEEVFGSVMLVIPYKTEEEAIRIANDTDMGLAAGVFTRDLAKAHKFSEALHAGTVYVNTFNDVSPFVPFGGFDESGFGRENGTAAIEHYTQMKSVFVNTAPLPSPF